MSIADGSYALGPEFGQLLIRTSRTGLGARAGHDLTIEVTRWQADLTVDSAELGRSSVAVEADGAEIKKTIREKILHTGEHGSITFRSTRVAGTPESFSIEGDLTITGRTQPVVVHGRLSGDRVQGSAAIVQSHWDIKPYTAFLGALKLADEVTVEFSISVTPGG